MKGMIFSAFLEMVEENYSMDLTDHIIEESNLASGGSYTTIGTYDHEEIITLVGHLSEHTNIPVSDLLKTFGRYMFAQLVRIHPYFIEGLENALDFLLQVDQYIHVEVRKLYPDAELPVINYEQPDENTLVMIYSSKRPFADLAEGMIGGCIHLFNENITVDREDTSEIPGTGARFTLHRQVSGNV